MRAGGRRHDEGKVISVLLLLSPWGESKDCRVRLFGESWPLYREPTEPELELEALNEDLEIQKKVRRERIRNGKFRARAICHVLYYLFWTFLAQSGCHTS